MKSHKFIVALALLLLLIPPAFGRTTDGGSTWENLDPPREFSSVHFLDANTGWGVVGSDEWAYDLHRIWHTTDGGVTWRWVDRTNGTLADLGGVDFVDASHGWAVGDGGAILRYRDEQSAVDQQFTPYPSSSILSVYPNPFNTRTIIQYSLPEQSLVTIDIFDILGRKIETLAKGVKPAGNHQTIWDASGQPSGIYFYRIKAGDMVETKKMVLIK